MKDTPHKQILITRPQPEAQEFANEIAQMGIGAIISPVVKITPLKYASPKIEQFKAIIFTSINGVRFFKADDFYGYPVLCVGTRTAAAARELGYKVIASAESAEALTRLIKAQGFEAGSKLLYVRGEDIAFDFVSALPEFIWSWVIVYNAKPLSEISFEAKIAIENNKIQAVVFFSKRSAELFINIVKREKLQPALSALKALCMSQSVLECVQPTMWECVYVSKTPDREAMVSLVKSICIEI